MLLTKIINFLCQMKINIITVGKFDDMGYQIAFENYLKRINMEIYIMMIYGKIQNLLTLSLVWIRVYAIVEQHMLLKYNI